MNSKSTWSYVAIAGILFAFIVWVERPFRDKHATATVLSVAAHVAIVGGVAWLVLVSVTDQLPQVPSITAFVAPAPVPSPPP